MENLEHAIEQIRQQLPEVTLMENEPMKAHCSFKIGGPVRAYAVPSDITSLSKLCDLLKKEHVAPLVLGNGTNILFPDEGLKDVIIISTEKLTRLTLLPDGAIYAECGVSMAKLANFAQQNGLTGLEFASGIPGTVGGGIVMNAGAYNGEIRDTLESAECLYFNEPGVWELTNEQCCFGYRTSFFKKTGGCTVTSAIFRLKTANSEEIAAKMRELNEKRREKQPLDYPSAGSAFKRPEGYFAAALIEECGLKGYSIGGAQVSAKHSGFVINAGNATSHDVYDLMMHVRETVLLQKNVVLEPEIIMLAPDFVPAHSTASAEGTIKSENT